MRYFSVLAVMAAAFVGSTVFAQGYGFDYACRLDSAKGKGGTCYVRGRICRDSSGNLRGCLSPIPSAERQIEASIAVRCTDGFRLLDRRADLDREDDNLLIIGEDSDHEATLVIEGAFENGSGNEYDALLETVHEGSTATWAGECRVRRVLPAP